MKRLPEAIEFDAVIDGRKQTITIPAGTVLTGCDCEVCQTIRASS